MSDAYPADPLAPFWGIHSVKNDCPVMRGWAKSEEEARAHLESIKSSDPEPEDRYWIEQMTVPDVETQKAIGTIPEDA